MVRRKHMGGGKTHLAKLKGVDSLTRRRLVRVKYLRQSGKGVADLLPACVSRDAKVVVIVRWFGRHPRVRIHRVGFKGC